MKTRNRLLEFLKEISAKNRMCKTSLTYKRYNIKFWIKHQSRICGEVVDLGLFPSDWLQSQLYKFIEIAHMDRTMG